MLVDPITKQALEKSMANESYTSDREEFKIRNGVICFLSKKDEFYEGAYLNKIRYIPTRDCFPFNLPLWIISNGYVWEVKKQFKPHETLLELGCASGVNYFGTRYNMIGLDLSFDSLNEVEGYKLLLQSDALNLPLEDNCLDGIISSYFWEHISREDKLKMLKEFNRVLKPGGKLVFLYDIETNNPMVRSMKRATPKIYKELFLDKDAHIGYEDALSNKQHFVSAKFKVLKHFAMERTLFNSLSVYDKMSHYKGWVKYYSKLMLFLSRGKIGFYTYSFILRCIDVSVGRLFAAKNGRIIISVLKK